MSSATRGKACACAQYLSGEPHLSSVHLLFPASNAAVGQAPRWAKSSRSGNTSGTPSPGTLASSATRGKACACAQHRSGEPYLPSAHLLFPASNAAMDQSPLSERCSRSGNTSGAPSLGTLASSATRGKACACAQHLPGEPHLPSVSPLFAASNAAIALAPLSETCSRSGNTSGAPSPGTLASSATRGKTCACAQYPSGEHHLSEPHLPSAHLLFAASNAAMDQAPTWARSSRSGNTSGTPSPGTLASSATRGKACACAQYPSGEHHLPSVHLLFAASNAAMDQSPLRQRSSRSGNTSGTPSIGTLASSATGIRKLRRKATCSLPDGYRTSTGKGKWSRAVIG